jgi:hypothetical protein
MKINGTVFLIFFVVLLGMMGYAVVWVSEKAGWEMAMGLGISGVITMIVFGQQILSNIQVNGILTSLIDYDKQQVGVEKQRAQIQLENAKAMRDTNKVEGRISEAQYRTMLETAKKMAGYLSDAELAKVKNEMYALSGPTSNSDEFEL